MKEIFVTFRTIVTFPTPGPACMAALVPRGDAQDQARLPAHPHVVAQRCVRRRGRGRCRRRRRSGGGASDGVAGRGAQPREQRALSRYRFATVITSTCVQQIFVNDRQSQRKVGTSRHFGLRWQHFCYISAACTAEKMGGWE